MCARSPIMHQYWGSKYGSECDRLWQCPSQFSILNVYSVYQKFSVSFFTTAQCTKPTAPHCRQRWWSFLKIHILSFSYCLYSRYTLTDLAFYIVFFSCLNLSLTCSTTFSPPPSFCTFLLISLSFLLPCLWLQETCLSPRHYPDTLWMCLWTQWEQSQWYMTVIPPVQHDTAVSCHGRRDDLYSALLLMASISDVNVKGLILHSYAQIETSWH